LAGACCMIGETVRRRRPTLLPLGSKRSVIFLRGGTVRRKPLPSDWLCSEWSTWTSNHGPRRMVPAPVPIAHARVSVSSPWVPQPFAQVASRPLHETQGRAASRSPAAWLAFRGFFPARWHDKAQAALPRTLATSC
jgi:hypothetical protein